MLADPDPDADLLGAVPLLDHHAAKGDGVSFLTESLAKSFGNAELFGVVPLKATFLKADGVLAVQVVAMILVIAMTATTFTTQRQLMSKNMPADALSGPYAQQQKLLLYVLPVVFAVGGIAFPIGVLFYWTTSNLWTMGQQFYVIRNNPAPGTAAATAKEDRDRGEGRQAGTTVEVVESDARGRGGAPPPAAAAAEEAVPRTAQEADARWVEARPEAQPRGRTTVSDEQVSRGPDPG